MLTGISGSKTVLIAARMDGRNSAKRAGSLTIPAVRSSERSGAAVADSGWMTGRGFIGIHPVMHDAECTMHNQKRKERAPQRLPRGLYCRDEWLDPPCALCIVHCELRVDRSGHSVDTRVSPPLTAARRVCHDRVAHFIRLGCSRT